MIDLQTGHIRVKSQRLRAKGQRLFFHYQRYFQAVEALGTLVVKWAMVFRHVCPCRRPHARRTFWPGRRIPATLPVREKLCRRETGFAEK